MPAKQIKKASAPINLDNVKKAAKPKRQYKEPMPVKEGLEPAPPAKEPPVFKQLMDYTLADLASLRTIEHQAIAEQLGELGFRMWDGALEKVAFINSPPTKRAEKLKRGLELVARFGHVNAWAFEKLLGAEEMLRGSNAKINADLDEHITKLRQLEKKLEEVEEKTKVQADMLMANEEALTRLHYQLNLSKDSKQRTVQALHHLVALL